MEKLKTLPHKNLFYFCFIIFFIFLILSYWQFNRYKTNESQSYDPLENANDTEDVFVGRVRCQSVGDESWVSMWIVADNVYGKGAALNAVQIIQNLIENNKLC